MLFSTKQIIIIANERENHRETTVMKKCPQCNKVFEDSLAYCTDDGTDLIEENFVLPSENSVEEKEEETLIHHEPIKIDIPQPLPPTPQINYQIPTTGNVIPVIVEKKRNTWNYFLVLTIGVILGSVLVAGVFIVILSQLRSSNTEKPSENVQISSGKHDSRNNTRKDAEFNGSVLSDSANIRSAPSSTVLDSLPRNDRLNILERDGAWYRVICEHGVAGWMHGNTIRFNDGETAF